MSLVTEFCGFPRRSIDCQDCDLTYFLLSPEVLANFFGQRTTVMLLTLFQGKSSRWIVSYYMPREAFKASGLTCLSEVTLFKQQFEELPAFKSLILVLSFSLVNLVEKWSKVV